jgi:hypothetical protein
MYKRCLESGAKYVAICEGDDYWTDPLKLQLQIEEMQKYPNVDISFHPVQMLIDGKLGGTLSKHVNHTKLFTMSEVILGGGGFCPTSSLMVQSKVIEIISSWDFSDTPCGDYFLQIFGARRGGALYIDKVMSVYRSGHIGSWLARFKDSEEFISSLKKMNMAMCKLYDHLGGHYLYEVYRASAILSYNALKLQDVDRNYRKEIYNSHSKFFTLKERLLWYFVYSKSSVFKMIRVVKKHVRHLKYSS